MNFSSPIIKELPPEKYLRTIFKRIPNNVILNKFLPNTGATTLEIDSRRHSIIIEPNVPVIEGKEAEHNKSLPYKKILGVYEGVRVDAISEYLAIPGSFKKIITTPESFSKVKEAINLSGYNLYNDFFLLFDECDRIIQDTGYRKKITLPLNDFFKFKKRAMISATPLPPSDPRFEKHKFKYVKIKPIFEYRRQLKLIPTNSIILSLKKYLDSHVSNNYFIFMNSTDVIASIVENLGIKNETNIYCARESVYKLKINKYPNSYEHLSAFKKYNFFTSRFFSAVDIKLPYKPTIIMLTDTTHAFHSILDPYTESVQIIGRFRNGIQRAVHITTIDSAHTPKSEVVAKGYLEGCESAYNELKKLRIAATSAGSVSTLDEALKRVEYAEFINDDDSKNHFMWDNYINEERVKAYYSSSVDIIQAYQNCPHFKMHIQSDNFPLIETVINRLSKMVSKNLVCKRVSDALNNIFTTTNNFSADDIEYVHKQLSKTFPWVTDAYHKLGYHKIQLLGFDVSRIKKAIYDQNGASEKSNFELLNRLALEFETGSSYPAITIIKSLREIIDDLGLQLKPQIKLLSEFFELSPRTTIARDANKKDIKGYSILRRKFRTLGDL